MKRPTITGEIVGRRGWIVDTSPFMVGTPCLRSSWAQSRGWFPGENIASCYHGRNHAAPHVRCECGLYAVYRPETVLRFMHGAVEAGCAIVGLVTAWGDIEVHIDGFRASHARVAALVDDPRLGIGVAWRLAQVYGVPLISYDNWLDDSFIAEFGQVVPVENRPHVSERRGVRPYRSRRDIGAKLMGAPAVVAASVLTMVLNTFWPIISLMGLGVVVTLSAVLFPSWWDA